MKKSILDIIVELTGQNPIQYSGHLKAIKCPFHDDSKPSLVIYADTNSYFCFPCSAGGDVYNFYSKFKNISYRAAKEALDGNTDVLQEITETLDGLGIKDAIDYSKELNLSISKYCRDIIYKNPERIKDTLKFLQKIDKEYLTKQVSSDIVNRVMLESRQLEKEVL